MNQRNGEGKSADRSYELLAPGLLKSEKPILLLFSGGGDSVALLAALVDFRGEDCVLALHVDYRLRGRASASDSELCQQLCTQMGVRLIIEQAPDGFAEGGNLQERARVLRYELAERIAEREGIEEIAVAHTADDQAETILYRLFASPGRRALQGMAPRRGKIVRPFLNVRRETLREFNRSRGLPWREDSSNKNDKFARVRARELLKQAEALHPAAIENLLSTAGQLREETAALDAVVGELLADSTADDGSLEASALAQIPAALGSLVLRRYVEESLGRPVPAAAHALTEVLRLAAAGGSHTVQVEGAQLTIEYGKVVVGGAEETAPANTELTVPGEAQFGVWRVSAGGLSLKGSDLHSVSIPLGALKNLTIRARRDGDRMRPRGLGGSKSLQDLFTDRKVPRRLRAAHPVVCAGERILWVPGVAIAEDAENADAEATTLSAARLH